MPLTSLSSGFQSLPPLPTSKLRPSGADSWVGEFVYILVLCVSLQCTILWGWEFLPPSQMPQVFTDRDFEALFPCSGILGCEVCLTPQLFLPVYPHMNVGTPSLPAPTSPALSSSYCFAIHPLCPGWPCLPLLTAWMNVSSLTSWLSDFHTVQFSGSSDCFLFLNWLLSFFWLCEEAKCLPMLLSWPEVQNLRQG